MDIVKSREEKRLVELIKYLKSCLQDEEQQLFTAVPMGMTEIMSSNYSSTITEVSYYETMGHWDNFSWEQESDNHMSLIL